MKLSFKAKRKNSLTKTDTFPCSWIIQTVSMEAPRSGQAGF